MRRGAIWRSLYVQVLIAIALGIVLGIFWPHFAQQLKPLGDGFIKLIKLLIAPIIFCTVVDRHRGHGQAARGRQGRRAGAAVLRGGVHDRAGHRPGGRERREAGRGRSTPTRRRSIPRPSPSTPPRAACPGVTEFILNVIPNTFFGAFASGEVLQMLLLAVLFGFALHAVGGRGQPAVPDSSRRSGRCCSPSSATSCGSPRWAPWARWPSRSASYGAAVAAGDWRASWAASTSPAPVRARACWG